MLNRSSSKSASVFTSFLGKERFGVRVEATPTYTVQNRADHNTDMTPDLISHKVFLKSFCRSQRPHKSVNLSFTVTSNKNKQTDLCGNILLQNDIENTLCRIKQR